MHTSRLGEKASFSISAVIYGNVRAVGCWRCFVANSLSQLCDRNYEKILSRKTLVETCGIS